MADRRAMQALLQEIETEMRRLGLWENVAPLPAAFESQLPFCFDTMTFNQWLQWIFIARFRAILAADHALPEVCSIAIMAEEAFKELSLDTAALIELLQRFDGFFPASCGTGQAT